MEVLFAAVGLWLLFAVVLGHYVGRVPKLGDQMAAEARRRARANGRPDWQWPKRGS